MEQKKANINKATICHATGTAKRFAKKTEQTFTDFQEDSDKESRIIKGWCKCCFYLVGRAGGAAMTGRKCGICNSHHIYSSTFTDVICYYCAIENNLCKHCGGDIDMKERRKARPYESAGGSGE